MTRPNSTLGIMDWGKEAKRELNTVVHCTLFSVCRYSVTVASDSCCHDFPTMMFILKKWSKKIEGEELERYRKMLQNMTFWNIYSGFLKLREMVSWDSGFLTFLWLMLPFSMYWKSALHSHFNRSYLCVPSFAL